MSAYPCPVCKKPLTKREYESALGILKGRERHLERDKTELTRKLKAAQERATRAREAGISEERSRTQRLLKGKDKQIATLQERIEQLKKGTTPQTDGLEFEEKLTQRLRREFPEDEVLHKGRGGDILHIVRFEGRDAGTIIYECKRCPGINRQHIEQTHQAKQMRQADFAVLVTTGTKKGFSGLAAMNGVLVVSPLGTVPLAGLVRLHLIEMLRTKVAGQQRAIIAQNLLGYITSPAFKNPIEEVAKVASELEEMIHQEARDHYRVWKRRWQLYQTIRWDSGQVQSNVQQVLHGKVPVALPRRRVILQLDIGTA